MVEEPQDVDATDADGLSLPTSGTQSVYDFLVTYSSARRFAEYLVYLAGTASRTAQVAREALFDTAHDDDERARYAPSDDHLAPVVELALQRQFVLESLVARHVENYLNYLASLLFQIFVARPEAMKSREKVDLEFVLGHGSMESLTRGIAERKVDALSYASFRDLADFFADRFHLSVCRAVDFDELTEAIELRNIIVHNRCRVNSRFVEKTGRRKEQLGKVVSLGLPYLDTVGPKILQAVVDLDAAACSRLSLPMRPIDLREGKAEARQRALAHIKAGANQGSV